MRELVRDLRIFRARVGELVDEALQTIVRDVAADVLARELQLEPANVQSIAESTIRRYFAEQPVRVRVSPQDAGRLACGIPVVADDSLLPGDVAIDLRSGSVDASLGVRLDAVLRSCS